MKYVSILILLAAATVSSFAQTEQAPIVEKDLKYKNWNYKTLAGNETIDLRKFADGRKLVLVVYFAPWCHNWKHEAPFVQKMYEKYKNNGLAVIGVGEYDSIDSIKNSIEFFKIGFPVVYESDSKNARLKTSHYDYRNDTGDTRDWGSPWHVFFEPSKVSDKGDVLTKRLFIAAGELIESDAEKFIREKLGLPSEEIKAESAKKDLEVCEEPKILNLKKP